MKSYALENFDVYLGRNGKLIFVWNGDKFETNIKELEHLIEWSKQNINKEKLI